MYEDDVITTLTVIVAMCLLLLCAVLLGYQVSPTNALTAEAGKWTLYLLNLLPFPPDLHSEAGWDRGLEMIPGGQLAAELINNRTDLLDRFKLQVVDLPSEACGMEMVTEGLLNFYQHIVQHKPDGSIVGVVGLLCPSVTRVIAPLAGRPNISLIQVAGSPAFSYQQSGRFPLLFHMLSSTSFGDAMWKMMEVFGWKNIGLIHDYSKQQLHQTAYDFSRRVQMEGLSLTVNIGVSELVTTSLIDNIRQNKGKVFMTFVTVSKAASLLCQVYRNNFHWPTYVYFFQEHLIQDVLNTPSACSHTEMMLAMEGVFFLQYKLAVHPDDTLISGLTYKEYQMLYEKQLRELSKQTDLPLQGNMYGNVVHDAVWALNSSLHTFKALNLSINFTLDGPNWRVVSDTITKHLHKVSLMGASGRVKFANQSIRSLINIFQVQKGKQVLMGVYDPNSDTIENFSFPTYVPKDDFETVYYVLPKWLSISCYTICGICYVITTIILCLFLYWRQRSEIKATSPYLSLLIIFACYLMYTVIVCRTVVLSTISVIESDSGTLFTFLCNVYAWSGFIGAIIIFSTLLMRLVRTFHVFRAFHKTGKFWSDRFLLLGIGGICFGMILILTIWTSSDPLCRTTKTHYVQDATPPYYSSVVTCSSNYLHVWVFACTIYTIVLITIVMWFAIQTRHIHRPNFKDTKKINAFLFIVVITLLLDVPLWAMMTVVENHLGTHVTFSVVFLSISLSALLFLFVPKLLPQCRVHISTAVCRAVTHFQ